MAKKILISYFSCSNVTKKLAKLISEVTKGDLFEIKPALPYTNADLDWTNRDSRSSIEMKDHSSRPEIEEKLSNMTEYDIIFVGFPIWWYIAPTIINTFLESYDFSGKTIVPFCTSGGSGVGQTDEKLHVSCPNSVNWKPAKLLNRATKSDIEKWIENLAI